MQVARRMCKRNTQTNLLSAGVTASRIRNKKKWKKEKENKKKTTISNIKN